jgi:hypothetical protein
MKHGDQAALYQAQVPQRKAFIPYSTSFLLILFSLFYKL